jgi:hypothetical protein
MLTAVVVRENAHPADLVVRPSPPRAPVSRAYLTMGVDALLRLTRDQEKSA